MGCPWPPAGPSSALRVEPIHSGGGGGRCLALLAPSSICMCVCAWGKYARFVSMCLCQCVMCTRELIYFVHNHQQVNKPTDRWVCVCSWWEFMYMTVAVCTYVGLSVDVCLYVYMCVCRLTGYMCMSCVCLYVCVCRRPARPAGSNDGCDGAGRGRQHRPMAANHDTPARPNTTNRQLHRRTHPGQVTACGTPLSAGHRTRSHGRAPSKSTFV